MHSPTSVVSHHSLSPFHSLEGVTGLLNWASLHRTFDWGQWILNMLSELICVLYCTSCFRLSGSGVITGDRGRRKWTRLLGVVILIRHLLFLDLNIHAFIPLLCLRARYCVNFVILGLFRWAWMFPLSHTPFLHTLCFPLSCCWLFHRCDFIFVAPGPPFSFFYFLNVSAFFSSTFRAYDYCRGL